MLLNFVFAFLDFFTTLNASLSAFRIPIVLEDVGERIILKCFSRV
jgi:hypothetical protein